MKRLSLICAVAAWGLASARAEFLFAPPNPTTNGFYTPTLDYADMVYEYSAWDIFYAPHSAGNYPDKFAPYGGVEVSPGVWAPETRTAAGFAANPVYNPSNALAFWDSRNPTITQQATSAFIIGPDISGNIYTYSQPTSYVLDNSPDYGGDGTGTVIFQFQTDGTLVDFSSIKLVYSDGFNTHEILATDAEYLREYHTTGGGGHWSADAGYANRVAIQWDLSGLTDAFGNPISDYQILWNSQTTSMSLQKVDLVTANTYQAGIPISASWNGGAGAWSDSAKWSLNSNSGLVSPQENGNIKFQSPAAATVTLDANHAVGEIVIGTASPVTIDAVGGARLLANTGVTTTAEATGLYTINADYELGALNFFEINAGTVAMNGAISGAYGLVKSGEGTLVLAHDNTFTGFLGIQGGTLRIEGSNAYTGGTTVVNGRLIVAADAGATGALGNSASALVVGADESLYQYANPGDGAELLIAGDHAIARDVLLAAGDNSKRLGAIDTSSGAVFSGEIHFTGNPANPDDTDSAAGNVKLSAQGATDRVTFAGPMTGGAGDASVLVDGAGTVVFSGVAKTYANATTVSGGTLLLAAGSGYTGSGDVTVAAGGTLRVDGVLGGGGALSVAGGTLAGAGTVSRDFTIAGGAMLAPGSGGVGALHAASATWGAGGIYIWEIGGSGWDLLDLADSLSITATSYAPFEIRVVSLGLLEGFDASASSSWVIAEAASGVLGFDASAFRVDTEGFANDFAGNFRIERDGSSIVLAYSPVPEPSAWALAGAGGLFLFLTMLRGRLRPAPPKNTL